MPTYCYQCECGRTEERVFSVSRRKKAIKCEDCGMMAERNLAAELRGGFSPNDQSYGHRPSLAMECDAEDVRKEMDYDRQHGLGHTRYVKTGLGSVAPIYESRAHQKRYEESRGFWNKDGGYGDSRRRTG